MRYEDQKLLRTYARLQLEISVSRNPTAAMEVTPETVTRSVGFKKLRAFFLSLSPRKRERYRHIMQGEIDGVRKIVEQAKATGEELSLADVEFLIRDDAGDEVKLQNLAPEARCPGSSGAILRAIGGFVSCAACARRWPVHEVTEFRIPTHEPPDAPE